MNRRLLAPVVMLGTLVALLWAGSGASAASTYRVIYRFAGGADGAAPVARLVADGRGNLFGTTSYGGSVACDGYGCGTIFELMKPATRGGAWKETVLYRFTGGTDSKFPVTALARDSAGNLYGTTSGAFIDCEGQILCGTVYELSPPGYRRSIWKLTTLHRFSGHADGGCPLGNLLLDSLGDLFGTSCYGGPYGYGTVFEFRPPAHGGDDWTETVLFGFPQDSRGHEPHGGIRFDPAGNAYGTTYAGGVAEQGVAYKLTPAGAGQHWRETVLAFFDGNNGRWPLSEPVLDARGNVFATTLTGGSGGCANGTVFQLTPPRFQETLAYVFCNGNDGGSPTGQLAIDAGRIYGTTTNAGAGNNGTAFALTPPAKKGGAWTETVLHAFAGRPDGSEPLSGMMLSNGALYGTTIAGGRGPCLLHGNLAYCGVVYEIMP
jgi:uncharacterized repeat protein (TIGR03803 family)